MTDVTAIVPARAGSRRLKDKNVLMFDGEPMLARKVRQLKACPAVTRVIVSSDSVEYLKIGAEAGAEAHHRRPEHADDISVPFGEVVRAVCEDVPGTHILWAPCTSPLVGPSIYADAIRQYFCGLVQGFDSLVSLQAFQRFVWDDHGPMNYRGDAGHVVSQDLPILYFMCDAILMAPRSSMIEWAYWHGPKPQKFLIGKREAVDVDDGLDFQCAKAWL